MRVDAFYRPNHHRLIVDDECPVFPFKGGESMALIQQSGGVKILLHVIAGYRRKLNALMPSDRLYATKHSRPPEKRNQHFTLSGKRIPSWAHHHPRRTR